MSIKQILRGLLMTEFLQIISSSVATIDQRCNGQQFFSCHFNHKTMILWCDNSNLTSVPIPHPTNTLITSQITPNNSRSIYFNHSCLNSLDPEILAYYPRLTSFIANDNDVTQVVGLTFVHNIKLQKLVLARNRIHTIDDRAFAGLKELRHLDLRGNHMQTINKKMLKHLPNLLFLDLSRNRIRKLDEHSFFRLQHLQHLDLSNNKLREVVPRLLQGNDELRVFNLRNNDVTGFPDNFFQYNVNLQRVDISRNNISCMSGNTFQNNTNLAEVLMIDNNLRIPNKRWFDNIHRVMAPEVERPLVENPWHCDCESSEYYIFLNSLASTNQWKQALDIRCASPSPVQDMFLSQLPRSVFKNCNNLLSPPTDCEVVRRQPSKDDGRDDIGEDDYDETTVTSQTTRTKPQSKPVEANDQGFNLLYLLLAFVSGILFGGILLCFFFLQKYRKIKSVQNIKNNKNELKYGESSEKGDEGDDLLEIFTQQVRNDTEITDLDSVTVTESAPLRIVSEIILEERGRGVGRSPQLNRHLSSRDLDETIVKTFLHPRQEQEQFDRISNHTYQSVNTPTSSLSRTPEHQPSTTGPSQNLYSSVVPGYFNYGSK